MRTYSQPGVILMSIFLCWGYFGRIKQKYATFLIYCSFTTGRQFFSNSQKLTGMMFFSFEIPFAHFSFNFSFIFSLFDWKKFQSPFKNSNHYVKFFRVKCFHCGGVFRFWPKNLFDTSQHCSDTSHTYILLSWRPVVLSVFSFFSPVFLQQLEVASALLKWAI